MKNSQTKFDFSARKLSYLHTDLACECVPRQNKTVGVEHKSFLLDGYEAWETAVTSPEGEAATGRRQGRYLTLFCPSLSSPARLCAQQLTDAVTALILDFADNMGFEITPDTSILVAGLGNRFITTDAIGPRTAEKITATYELNRENKDFAALGAPSVSVIIPGVSSQTGMDASHIIKAAAEAVRADFIIAVDALAARSTDRLCSTVQISDCGIHPGAGIGNHRAPITKETMGVPVMAIGFPTVVSSSTLILDALEKAGAGDISPALEKILENGKSFFVSHGDSDTVCEDASTVLADAIEQSFLHKLYS